MEVLSSEVRVGGDDGRGPFTRRLVVTAATTSIPRKTAPKSQREATTAARRAANSRSGPASAERVEWQHSKASGL